MIVHVFTANRKHLVPQIVDGFLKYITKEQYFLLVGNKNVNEKIYEDIFKKYSKNNYHIIKSFTDLKKVSKKFQDEFVLLHGVPYKWMFYYITSGFKNVNWICWGAGAKINKSNWKSVIFTPLKSLIYRRFKKVGVLMPQDGATLKQDYKIKKTTLLSYFGTIDSFPYTESDIQEDTEKAEKKNIYLGNNSSCLNTYLSLIEKLKRFNQYIKITCMANYSFQESSISRELQKRGKEIFEENFILDTKLYPLNEYYSFMNNCDIYICAAQKQSGLGAIYTCLRLGKKVFLTEINYEWIKSLGCHIFSVDEIDKMEPEDFLEDLSYEEKINNYRAIKSYLNIEQILKKWNEFLS